MLRPWADTSAASLVVAGILGSVVATTTGPYIAMGVAIYGGNTEPVEPLLPFPWLVFATAIGCGILGRVQVARTEPGGRQRAWSGLVLAGAIAVAAVPVVHLVRLVGETSP